MKSNVKPEQGALALYYDGKRAPEVKAKGYRELADAIIAKAKENGVMLHNDPQLFKQLENLEVGQLIAPQMYVVIAELIAFSYVIRGKFPDSWQ